MWIGFRERHSSREYVRRLLTFIEQEGLSVSANALQP